MTIDEIIRELERTKDYPASDPASDESLDSAIAIIRKHQNMPTLLNQLDKAFEDKRIVMIAEYDMTNDMFRIYFRDILDKTEHLYTTKGLRKYPDKIY